MGSSKRQESAEKGAESQRAQPGLSTVTPKHHPEGPRGFLAPARGGDRSFSPCPALWGSAGSEDEECTAPAACPGSSAAKHRAPGGSSCDIPQRLSARAVVPAPQCPRSPGWSKLLCWHSVEQSPQHRSPAPLGVSASALPAPPAVVAL